MGLLIHLDRISVQLSLFLWVSFSNLRQLYTTVLMRCSFYLLSLLGFVFNRLTQFLVWTCFKQVKFKCEFSNLWNDALIVHKSFTWIYLIFTFIWCISQFLYKILLNNRSKIVVSSSRHSDWVVSKFASPDITFSACLFFLKCRFWCLGLFLRLFSENIFQVDLFGFEELLHFIDPFVDWPLVFGIFIRKKSESNDILLDRKLDLFEFLMILDWILCLSQNLQP